MKGVGSRGLARLYWRNELTSANTVGKMPIRASATVAGARKAKAARVLFHRVGKRGLDMEPRCRLMVSKSISRPPTKSWAAASRFDYFNNFALPS